MVEKRRRNWSLINMTMGFKSSVVEGAIKEQDGK